MQAGTEGRRVACVAGFGVAGISAAVARRFGRAGFDVALLARREDRLRQGEEDLRALGALPICACSVLYTPAAADA
jgi:uncharacterized protein